MELLDMCLLHLKCGWSDRGTIFISNASDKYSAFERRYAIGVNYTLGFWRQYKEEYKISD